LDPRRLARKGGMMDIPANVIAAAQAGQRKYGVWASVALAQFGLESNWGRSMPAGSNNPFGIKAVAGQPFVIAHTREVIGGRSVYIDAKFAKFANFTEAFEAHAKLLATSHYYTAAMAHAYGKPGANAEDFIQGLGAYATDPGYRTALIRLARTNGLYKYDTLDTPTVAVPTSVPPIVMTSVAQILNNLFGGTVSTAIGVISAAYAFIVYNHIQLSSLPINTDWKAWAVLGLILVFGMGAAPTPKSEALPPSLPPKGNHMDPTVLLKLISVFEAFIPVMEKIAADIPQIHKDIEAIKTANQPNESVAAQIDNILARLNNLSK